MPVAASALPPCAYRAALTDLLGVFPAGSDWRQTEAVAERLDELEYEARWGGAPETTLAAIRGARVLLAIAGSPPSRELITGRAAPARTDPRRCGIV
ncbi:hypothetical protein [Methylobacterium brachiatum]|jgi:hypothetical protein|uniref:hypothetical protein n=1 Tax=Methylobacterium brachiatum TaxID=269660 RepID=UPI00244A5233|nr:hypothetical protein [Methylobacterium brachiatum]MDH2313282.1 hypothetical protein [Methylobacterium brachiatum]